MKNIYDMTFTEFIQKRNEEREDKDNMYPVPMTDHEAIHFIEKYLWNSIIEDPISNAQANTIIVHEILYKYSKEYRKEYNKFVKLKRRNKNGKS